MPTGLLVAAAGLVLVPLLLNALLLWLLCRLFRLRHASADGDPAKSTAVRFRRAVLLVIVVGVVGWACTAPLAYFGATSQDPKAQVAVSAGWLLMGVAVPLVVFLFGLPGSAPRKLGVWLIWRGGSVGVVLLSVFLFTAYFFETFVIPTGGMAPTVLGHNKEVVCPQCRLTFPINASHEVASGDGQPPLFISGCTCPGCRLNINFRSPGSPARPDAVPDPGWRTGDRIACGKGLFTGSGYKPNRLDLVIFEYPGAPNQPPPTQRILYLQRIAGLPGETIAIHRGDLYVAEGALEEAEGQRQFQAGQFRLLRKPLDVILAMRQLVYDTNHAASDLQGKEYERWRGDGWESPGKGEFRLGAGKEGALLYRHVLRDKPDRPQLITDFSAYNSWRGDGVIHQSPGENWTGDLILEAEVKVESAGGEVWLELGRGPDLFRAAFDPGKGTCSLGRTGGKQEPAVKNAAITPGRWMRLRFANVDGRLTLWIDNQLPFGDGVEYEAAKDIAPVPEHDGERPAGVGAKGVAVAVRNVRLYRDVYYTAARHGGPAEADVPEFRPDEPDTWESLKRAPVSVYPVKPGHYFVLGDNSPQSSDSRSWGVLEQRRLVGPAVARYYPFSRMGGLR